MKLKYKIMGLSVLIAVLASIFAAFSPSGTNERHYTDSDGELTVFSAPYGVEDVIVKTFTHDTLTTTEIDTLNLGYILQSPYQYSYQMKVQKISGTPSLKVVLDQRNNLGNSDWMGIDSVAISGADSTRTYFLMEGPYTYGIQHRLRLVGTSGENQYDITALLKKTR